MLKTNYLVLTLAVVSISGCSQGVANMKSRVELPCGDKPNCVSTQDLRKEYRLDPYVLKKGVTIVQIEAAALTLPRSKVISKTDDYLHITCTTKILRFVDDLELEIQGEKLLVRSESRVGYSDFGVNRKRADELRKILLENDLIHPDNLVKHYSK
ncbi:DUF1499 domain-containing protein [Vibrio marisflavi]|nr:DUF1499 domain-containing protein [Vibrio marisflavi]